MSGGRGRRAVVPDVSTITSRLSSDGLGITVRSEDGREEHTVNIRNWDAPASLLHEIAACLHHLSGQEGPWKSVETARQAPSRWLPFVRFCKVDGIESMNDFTAEHWATFIAEVKARHTKTTTAHNYIVLTRALLLAHAALPEATDSAVREKFFLPEDNSEQVHYSLDEFKALRSASRRVLREASERISANWALASLPAESVPEHEAARWSGLNKVLSGGFPTTRDEWIAIGAMTDANVLRARQTGEMRRALAALFLGPDEVVAAMTAIVCETGENFSTVIKRDAPSTAATAGDEDLTVYSSNLDKARRGPILRHMRENASGVDPHGRVLGLIVAATEPAREAAKRQGLRNPNRLLWSIDRKHCVLHSDVGKNSVHARRQEFPWLKDAPRLDFHVLRRTYVNRIGNREVHHSARTRIEKYLGKDPEHRTAWAAVAAAGLEALFEEAEATVVRILTRDEAAGRGLLAGPAEGDSTPTGMRCRDSDHHPETGQPCDDDFLCCLGCANAFATEEHLPLLVALYDLLEQTRHSSTAGLWEGRFQVAWARLTVMLRSLSEQQWATARSSRTQQDYDLAFAVVESREFEI